MALGLAARVRLRPLTTEHQRTIHAWLPEESVGARWRFNNGLPDYEDFVNQLWHGVLEQCVVCIGDDPTPHGVVSAYSPNFRNGTCYLSVASAPRALGSGLALAGAALFMDRLFETWPFRKIYADVTRYNLGAYASVLSKFAVVELVQKDASLWQGELHDRLTITFDRDRWEREASPFL